MQDADKNDIGGISKMTVKQLQRFLENCDDDVELVLESETGEALQVWECWIVNGTPHFTLQIAEYDTEDFSEVCSNCGSVFDYCDCD